MASFGAVKYKHNVKCSSCEKTLAHQGDTSLVVDAQGRPADMWDRTPGVVPSFYELTCPAPCNKPISLGSPGDVTVYKATNMNPGAYTAHPIRFVA